MSTVITSTHNALVQDCKKLQSSRKHRISRGRFIAEGFNLVGEAIRAGLCETLLLDETKADAFDPDASGDTEQVILAHHVFESLCETQSPQGVAAVCRFYVPPARDSISKVLFLNAVQDPGNVGTLIRTADAAAFDAVYLDERTADPYNPKALRASMGSILHIPVIATEDLAGTILELRRKGFTVIAGDLRGEDRISPGTDCSRCGVIVGNEGNGIDQIVLETASLRIKLPMPGKAESLNAAVAGSILMYDLIRIAERN